MSYRTHTPLPDADADRIAAILMHLEGSLNPGLRLLPLAVIGLGGVAEARVIAFLGDGGREPLTSADTRVLGQCLLLDRDIAREAHQLGKACFDAAAEAEARANAARTLAMPAVNRPANVGPR